MEGCLKLINFQLILSNLVPLAVFLRIGARTWLETIFQGKTNPQQCFTACAKVRLN